MASMDEDAREMAALRKKKQFQDHRAIYGNRSQIKEAQRELEEEQERRIARAREAADEAAKERERAAKREERAAALLGDDGKIVANRVTPKTEKKKHGSGSSGTVDDIPNAAELAQLGASTNDFGDNAPAIIIPAGFTSSSSSGSNGSAAKKVGPQKPSGPQKPGAQRPSSTSLAAQLGDDETDEKKDDDSATSADGSDHTNTDPAFLAFRASMGFEGFGRKKTAVDIAMEHAKLRRDEKDSKRKADEARTMAEAAHRRAVKAALAKGEAPPPPPASLTAAPAPPSEDKHDNSSSSSSSSSASSSSGSGGQKRKPTNNASSTDDRDDNDGADLSDDSDGDDNDNYGPARPASVDGGDRDSGRFNASHLPISHEVELKGHTKAVAALAVDKAGARVLTGSYDYDIRMYDFGGMNETMQSFRQIEPESGHQVRHLQYSISGDQFWCATGSARAKLYDREGRELAHFVKGDMYIHDLTHTAGHVASLTGGTWHPKDRHRLLTASVDGTLRLWDVNKTDKNLNVLKLKSRFAGKRAGVSACTYSADGNMIIGAGTDGSIHVWNGSGKVTREMKSVNAAHEPDTETSSLTLHSNNHTLVSRGGDSTMKIWDLRKFTAPVKVFTGLENQYAQTDAIFSPDASMIVTGTSNKEAEGKQKARPAAADKDGTVTEPAISSDDRGKLVFFDTLKLERVFSVGMSDKSIIRIVWHPVLNQIIATSSDTRTHVLYSPDKSTRGALMSVGRKVRAKDPSDFIEHHDIVLPHSLPMFRREATSKRQKVKDFKSTDPKKSMMPLPPSEAQRGFGGNTVNSGINSHFVSKFIEKKRDMRSEDPREALLAWDKKAQSDPMFFGRAYRETQPEAVFQEATELEAETEKKVNEAITARKA